MQAKENKQECPHCKGKVQTRSSKAVHVHLRIVYLQCQICGWKAVGELQLKHDLARPSVVNKEAVLPLAPVSVYRDSINGSQPKRYRA